MSRAFPALLLSAVVAIGGCSSYRLQELRYAEPKGTPFQMALFVAYRDFAVGQERLYDWKSAAYFAEKGLDVLYGYEAMPEELRDWNIAAARQPELKAARNELIKALTDDVKEVRPQLAAEAQFYFDCWLKQSENLVAAAEAAACQISFEEAMAELAPPPKPEAEKKPVAKKPAKKAAKAPAKKPVKKPAAKTPPLKAKATPPLEKVIESTAYIVFFEPGSVEINPAAQRILDMAAGRLAGSADYRIIISGDPSAADAGQWLEARAQAVKDHLAAAGIGQSAIDIEAAGKALSTTISPAGQSLPVARKVEIFIAE